MRWDIELLRVEAARLNRNVMPPGVPDVRQTQGGISGRFGCEAIIGLSGRFFGSVAPKGVRGFLEIAAAKGDMALNTEFARTRSPTTSGQAAQTPYTENRGRRGRSQLSGSSFRLSKPSGEGQGRAVEAPLEAGGKQCEHFEAQCKQTCLEIALEYSIC